jgi:hypothetical protein
MAAMDAVPKRSRCPRCLNGHAGHKWSYETEYDAWKMIGRMIRAGYKKVPNRVYACPYGYGYHKSSKPERERGYTAPGTKPRTGQGRVDP